MKEIVFLVTWTLCTNIPDFNEIQSTPDEYGRDNYSMVTLLPLRYKVIESIKSKEFTTEAEADTFISRMPIERSFSLNGQWCANPKKEKMEKK